MAKKLKGEINLPVLAKTFVFISLLFGLILSTFIFVLPVLLIISIINSKSKKNVIISFSRWYIQLGFKMLFVLNCSQLRKQLKQLAPPERPRVYVINHASMFDIILLHLLPDEVRILVKESYTRIPLLGPIIKASGHIVVKQPTDIDDSSASYDETVDAIKGGAVIAVFPEGTRSRDGTIARFKTGAFHLAYQSEAEIIPIVMDTWNIVRPGNGLWFRDTRLHSAVLEPIQFTEYCDLEPAALAKAIRKTMLEELKKIRDTRMKKEKKFYRAKEPYLSLDNKIYSKILG
jgi:1-acyl-sn-glycerol-3-phosphate acyltransferase